MQGPHARSGRSRLLVGVLAVAAFALVGCQGRDAVSVGAGAPSPSAPPTPLAQISVAPADTTTGVLPNTPIKVEVTDGTIEQVAVSTPDGSKVSGSVSADKTEWTSDAVLDYDTHYVVTAQAVDEHGLFTHTETSFQTIKPKALLKTSIEPINGETVGVGMPIVVKFTHSVTDRAAVQSALTLDMSEPVEGAWHWFGSKEVHFRPKVYWPAGEKVTLHVGLTAVDAGDGVWGAETRDVSFTIGDSHITTIDDKTHMMTVAVNGKPVRTIPVSLGRAKYPTTSGIHVVLARDAQRIMDSSTVGIPKGNPDYYREVVNWAVRISWSGEFVHSAPWSVKDQGHRNVSHGCVNAPPADAQWFYNLSRRGDIVTITGTPRPLESGNGLTDWNVSWANWVKGSAVPVAAGA